MKDKQQRAKSVAKLVQLRVIACSLDVISVLLNLHFDPGSANHASTLSLNFYWPDVLPDAKPTA